VNQLWKELLSNGIKKLAMCIKKDEMIFEISTDKVDTEIPSPEAGTLVEILVGEQETVEVGTIVAKLISWRSS
jgi:pyruvate dehydrogenase E2 component (dihydrolipoamide acetyltransferase)